MLALNELKKLAVKQQTTFLNCLREYVQHLFLAAFYQQKEADKVLFKGGTALRLIYGSPRFSEDLDFDGVQIGLDKLENLVLGALAEVEKTGLEVQIEESKKTSGGYLAWIGFKIYDYRIRIKLEISLRKGKKTEADLTMVHSVFGPPYNLVQLNERDLVREKMEALLSRAKPRDYYDLYFMLRSNLIRADEKQVLGKMFEKIKRTEIDFNRELKIFLPQNQHLIIRNFKKSLENEMKRYVG